jgi:DNA-binding FadR family transcriptional regulator
MLLSTIRDVYDQFRQQHVTRQRNYGFHPQNVEEHSRIVAAALSGDEEGCRTAIYDHLKRNLAA